MWRSKGFPVWQFYIGHNGSCLAYRTQREAGEALARLRHENDVEFKVVQFGEN
jgi:hypothetical protein